jgi:hypothetical protein
MGKSKRWFRALSEHSNGQDADCICTGLWRDCILVCVMDESPCYIVELLLDKDGDEEESNDILFVNRAWNNKYVNR